MAAGMMYYYTEEQRMISVMELWRIYRQVDQVDPFRAWIAENVRCGLLEVR